MGVEGLADFTAFVSNQFEFHQPIGYAPDLVYPQGVGHYSGHWNAIYSHLLKHIGVVGSVYRTHDYLYAWNDSTKMLGTCTDQNSDGYVVPSECPSNSFYLHLLNADTSGYSGINRRQYEISEVHASHISDADPNNPGIQSVPWADELPNGNELPPFVDLEVHSSVDVTTGPERERAPRLVFSTRGTTTRCSFSREVGSATISRL